MRQVLSAKPMEEGSDQGTIALECGKQRVRKLVFRLVVLVEEVPHAQDSTGAWLYGAMDACNDASRIG